MILGWGVIRDNGDVVLQRHICEGCLKVLASHGLQC